MTELASRIASAGQMGDFHPYGTGSTPMVMPLALVQIHQEGMSHQELHPVYTGDVNSAPLPATAPGSWGQVIAAGKP